MSERSLLLAGVTLAAAACAGAAPLQPAAAGCWMHAFAKEQYRPPVSTYTGPTHERLSLEGKQSLTLGPGARLEGYGKPDFERRRVVLPPGARVSSLEALRFEKRVDSFQLLCVPPLEP